MHDFQIYGHETAGSETNLFVKSRQYGAKLLLPKLQKWILDQIAKLTEFGRYLESLNRFLTSNSNECFSLSVIAANLLLTKLKQYRRTIHIFVFV